MASYTRPHTPPSSSFLDAIVTQKHKDTPTRAAILGVLFFCKQKGYKATSQDIKDIFSVVERTTKRISASKEPRTVHNVLDMGPDPRGRHRKFTLQDAQGVADHLEKQAHEGRQGTWKQIAYKAGYDVSNISERTIRNRMKELQYGTFLAAQKRWLNADIRKERVEFAMSYLALRPKSEDWQNVLWSDEIHFGLGKQRKKTVKRKLGDRYNPTCIQEVGQVDYDDEPLEKVIHGFAAVGYQYKRFFFYTTNNSNGKMNQRIYTNEILPTIEVDLHNRVLFEDQDSAHSSKITTKWKEQHHIR
jgi:hypothetical protein